MRLDKYLTECGLGSRREVKSLIKSGRVQINGIVTKDESIKVIDSAIVSFDGEQILAKKNRYYIMNKPKNCITAVKDNLHKTVFDLLPEWVIVKNLAPVGRLDIDTEGLLLFTNDGDLNHKLLSPNTHVPKVYHILTKNRVDNSQIKKLQRGVYIQSGNEKYLTKPSIAERSYPEKIYSIPEEIEYGDQIFMTLTEGKFHQVKLMILAVENEVLYLERLSFGTLTLGGLPRGKVRELEKIEISQLLSSISN
jgi:16S rRNA pseudouridine516 synthase